MIEDAKGIDVPLTLTFEALDSSAAWVFYLAGSRYMGCARPDSDWDFYVQDRPHLIEWLRSWGFTPMGVEEAGYDEDGVTRAIMQKKEGDAVIQVQVLKNVQLLRRVRDTIRDHLLEEHIKARKFDRAYIWNTLANILAYKADTFNALEF